MAEVSAKASLGTSGKLFFFSSGETYPKAQPVSLDGSVQKKSQVWEGAHL